MTAQSSLARHPSPPLIVLAVVHTLLFLAAVAIPTWLAAGAHYPSPFGPAELARQHFVDNAGAVRLGAVLLLGSAIPLGLFTATATSRLRFFRIEAAGVSIAAFGGTAAAILLALSGLVSWVLSQPGVAESAASVRALHLLAFAMGGPGFVALLGLLIAGVSVSATLHRKLPRSMLWFGLVLAVVAELSLLALFWPALLPLVPAARFFALVWLIATGALLPKTRGSRAAARAAQSAPAVGIPEGDAA